MSTQPSKTNPHTEKPAVGPGAAAGKPGATRRTRSRAISFAVMAFALLGLVAVGTVALVRQAVSDDTIDTAGATTPAQEASAEPDSAAEPRAASAAPETTAHASVAARAAAPTPAVQSRKDRPVNGTVAVRRAHKENAAQATESHDAEPSTDKVADVERAAAATTAPTTETAALSTVTITGCLEVSTDEDRFRLTDTEGIEAPKARSWRTGFLKKRSAPVDLVGTLDTAAMGRQVGKRVAATGVLTSRELQVSSVHVVASSCE